MHQILKTTLNLITTLHFSDSISKILLVNQNQVQKVNQQIVIGNNGKKKKMKKIKAFHSAIFHSLDLSSRKKTHKDDVISLLKRISRRMKKHGTCTKGHVWGRRK